MAKTSVVLSNTFNEFRTITNQIITEVNKLENGTSVIVANTVLANTFTANTSLRANTVTTNGSFNLTLNTNNGTNSGNIVIGQGLNANITLEPNGTGDVFLNTDIVRIGDQNVDATLSTWGTGDLILSTNTGTNSGTIRIFDGVDGPITLVPNGGGQVQLDTNVVRIGDSNLPATLTTNGTGDLTLSTNAGTNSGTIAIANGVNGNITLAPNGTGDVLLNADTVRVGDQNVDAIITSWGTGNLTLNTNSGTNSGSIAIANGVNGNISITPNGTGTVSVPRLSSSGQITSTVATGTAPFVVASTTVVTNLNADAVDGISIGTITGAGGIVYGTSTSAIAGSAAGTTGQAVISGGTGAPTFQNVASANGASSIVARDASGSFFGNIITGSTLATTGSLAANTVTTGGAFNLTLSTNGGTNSGNVIIGQGVNGNIVIEPNGTGDVQLNADIVRHGDQNADATLTTWGTGDLILSTNEGTNSGTVRIYDGVNGNVEIGPNGTGLTRVFNTGDSILRAERTSATATTVDVIARSGYGEVRTGTGRLQLNPTGGIVEVNSRLGIGSSGVTVPNALLHINDTRLFGTVSNANTIASINTTANTITFTATNSGISNGDMLFYSVVPAANAITGLTSNFFYYARVVNANTVTLHSTYSGAVTGGTPVILTGTLSADTHSVRKGIETAQIQNSIGNVSYLHTYEYRHTDGLDWTGVSTRIQKRIDITPHAYIEFNPPGGPEGIAFGTGSAAAASEAFRVNQAQQLILGNGDTSAAPPARLVRMTNGVGTNIAAGTLSIQGGLSTGSATGGAVRILTGTIGTSGTTLQTVVERFRIDPSASSTQVDIVMPATVNFGSTSTTFNVGSSTSTATFNGNLNVGTTSKASNTVVSVLAGDSNMAGFEAYGNSQGTGYLYVGQSANFGGGISYNGDGAPGYVQGENSDVITFYRRDNGPANNFPVFGYSYNSNTVLFLGDLDVRGTLANVPNTLGFEAVDSSNTSITVPITVRHLLSNTPAVGTGVGIGFTQETTDNNNEFGMMLGAILTDTTAGSEDFDFIVRLMQNGATNAERFRVSSAGNATLVGDLAVNGGDITTSQTTATVFDATASTLNVGSAASTMRIGATSGTLTIGNPTVVGTQATQNVYNTTATTVNFAGAATTLNIGASTGTTDIKNNLNVVGDVDIDGGDLTFSTTTANLVNATATTVNFAGAATTLNIGASTGTTDIKNNLNVTGDLDIDGGDLTVSTASFNLVNTTATTVNFAGAATTGNFGYGGALASTTNISNGTVGSGNTKTVNIGTSGASGSITNINVGSATAGATGLLAINTRTYYANTIYTGRGYQLTANFANTVGPKANTSNTETFSVYLGRMKSGQSRLRISTAGWGAEEAAEVLVYLGYDGTSNTGDKFISAHIAEWNGPVGYAEITSFHTAKVDAQTADIFMVYTLAVGVPAAQSHSLNWTAEGSYTGTSTDGFTVPTGVTIPTLNATNILPVVLKSTETSFNVSTNATFSQVVNAVDFNTTSDQRLKIKYGTGMFDGPELIKRINPYRFTWTNSGRISYGVFAQELEEILPELVAEREDGFKGVSYTPLIAVLIDTVKKQQDQINRLEALVNRLV